MSIEPYIFFPYRMDQKFRRRKVGEKLSLVPGKLDHATVAAYSVADRSKMLQSYTGKFLGP